VSYIFLFALDRLFYIEVEPKNVAKRRIPLHKNLHWSVIKDHTISPQPNCPAYTTETAKKSTLSFFFIQITEPRTNLNQTLHNNNSITKKEEMSNSFFTKKRTIYIILPITHYKAILSKRNSKTKVPHEDLDLHLHFNLPYVLIHDYNATIQQVIVHRTGHSVNRSFSI
jgi:hypothetical protein